MMYIPAFGCDLAYFGPDLAISWNWSIIFSCKTRALFMVLGLYSVILFYLSFNHLEVYLGAIMLW